MLYIIYCLFIKCFDLKLDIHDDIICPTLDQYISIGQSGFRRDRSTSDAQWGCKFLMAYVQKHQEEFYITVLISVRHSINCINLLQLLKSLINESDYRIIYNDTYSRSTWTHGQNTTICTPQGDALSPILFTEYLELSIRNHKENIPMNYSPVHHIFSYADNTDFISNTYADHFITSTYLPTN